MGLWSSPVPPHSSPHPQLLSCLDAGPERGWGEAAPAHGSPQRPGSRALSAVMSTASAAAAPPTARTLLARTAAGRNPSLAPKARGEEQRVCGCPGSPLPSAEA